MSSKERCPEAIVEHQPARIEAVADSPSAETAGNPWVELAGIFADDPTLMPMLDAIYAARDADRNALDLAQQIACNADNHGA